MSLLSSLLKTIYSTFNSLAKRVFIRLESLDSSNAKLNTSQEFTAEPIATPEIMTMKVGWGGEPLQKEVYTPPKIYTALLSHVIYSPQYNVVLKKSRAIIADSINTKRERDRFNIRTIYSNRVEKISGCCSLMRSPSISYYHTLIDNIPRLYLLAQPEYQDISEIKLLFSSKPSKLEQFYLEKLLPKNVKVTVVESDKLYEVERLIFPTFMTRQYAGYLPAFYIKYLWDKVAPKRPRNKINRIFISRIKRDESERRYILNEDELFNALKPFGFKRYTLENYSIEEQIELFYDAEYVIGTHGAGLSNIIFSSQIHVLELFPTWYVAPHYYFLAKSLEHHYQYLCCGSADNIHSNLSVDVLKVVHHLEGYLMKH